MKRKVFWLAKWDVYPPTDSARALIPKFKMLLWTKVFSLDSVLLVKIMADHHMTFKFRPVHSRLGVDCRLIKWAVPFGRLSRQFFKPFHTLTK